MQQMLKDKKAVILFLLPAVLLFTLVLFVPIVQCAYYSFNKLNFIGKVEKYVGFKNYVKLFTRDEIFMIALKNTIFFMIFSVVSQLIFGLLFAVLLTNMERGRNLFKNIIYMPCVLSSSALGLLFCFLLKPNIGLNQLLALLGIKGPLWLTEFNGFIPLPMWVIGFVALWQYVGQNMMLYMAQIMGINKSIYEASYVDGATKWQSFRAITMPLIKPMLVTAMSLNCIGSLKFFDLVYNLTQGGPNHVTENIATWIYYNGVQLSDKRGYACAISMVLLVLCLLTTFLVNKVIKPEHYEM